MSNRLIISDDDHLQAHVHLERIKAIASAVCVVERMSTCDALADHSLENLMVMIDCELDAAESVLARTEKLTEGIAS